MQVKGHVVHAVVVLIVGAAFSFPSFGDDIKFGEDDNIKELHGHHFAFGEDDIKELNGHHFAFGDNDVTESDGITFGEDDNIKELHGHHFAFGDNDVTESDGITFGDNSITTATPEPGILSMMFSGLLGLGLLVGVKRYRGNRLASET